MKRMFYLPIIPRLQRLYASMESAKQMRWHTLIPGPSNPTNKIDVYMQPLIDDHNQLWNEGVMTYA